MEKRTCAHCSGPMNLLREGARFCSAKCRVYANRASIPAELKVLDRWVRWDKTTRAGRETKVPLTLTGRVASSTNSRTWSDFASVKASTVGVGLGFVLNGDGVSVIDLDHCLRDGKPAEQAQAVLALFPTAWVEVSPSGDGLHIWGKAPAGPGRRIVLDGLAIEFYSTGRYVTVTGRTWRSGNTSTAIYLPDSLTPGHAAQKAQAS
jgi:primase-polymerase (primpol)-like protein